MTEKDALVALNAVPGLGSGKIRLLRAHFGSATAAAQAPYGALIASGHVTAAVAENIVHFSKDKFLEDEYNLVHQKGAQVLSAADDDFPRLLDGIPGAPVVLYIWGKKELLHGAGVAMVGSRVSSYYGRAVADKFAAAFARAGVVVVSGLARGIDTAAHKACLREGGSTVAVIGSGLNHVYPRENASLMQDISRVGAVVSEMPMQTPGFPANFPRRNRIISGLSLVTVVVEAGAGSGALITADFALEQGRDVFAVPANIDYETAQGSNRLLRDGARVALGPEDILDELRGQVELAFPEWDGQRALPKVRLTEAEWKFLGQLTADPLYIDDLCARVDQPLAAAAEIMLNLELKGIVRQLPGKYYVKV